MKNVWTLKDRKKREKTKGEDRQHEQSHARELRQRERMSERELYLERETGLQEILERELCKRVLSRSAERTLAGGTRGRRRLRQQERRKTGDGGEGEARRRGGGQQQSVKNTYVCNKKGAEPRD